MKLSKLYLTIFATAALALTGCNINAEVTPVDKTTNNKASSKTPTKSEGVELEPSIEIDKVTTTEMDSVYITLVEIIDIPESMKVKGKWSAHVGNIQASNYDCEGPESQSQKVCGIAFPTSKFKPGNEYTLTVKFEGKIGSQDAILKETKSFVASKPLE